MKIVVTGSLGNISKPLTERLVEKGHSVTVISSNAERQNAIEALGATAAIGTLEDVDFLTATFTGADIVYLMEPADNGDFFIPGFDFLGAKSAIGRNYKAAIEKSGVKKAVHLSSNGAEDKEGFGMLQFHYNVENILRELPEDVIIKHIRAAAFFPNVFYYTQTIKEQGAIFANYDSDQLEPWVAMEDIADTIVEEMESSFEERKIRYIASEEMTPVQLIELLEEAIGKKINWIVISDEQLLESMVSIGMDPANAKMYVEMTASRRGGKMFEGYFENNTTFGKRKLKDFIKETFLPVYNAL